VSKAHIITVKISYENHKETDFATTKRAHMYWLTNHILLFANMAEDMKEIYDLMDEKIEKLLMEFTLLWIGVGRLEGATSEEALWIHHVWTITEELLSLAIPRLQEDNPTLIWKIARLIAVVKSSLGN
jgi:hypothetical protein